MCTAAPPDDDDDDNDDVDDDDDNDDNVDDDDDDDCSLGLLELRPACHRDVQRVPGGEILQGLLSAQGLGGTRPGL